MDYLGSDSNSAATAENAVSLGMPWFAIRVKSNFERCVSLALRGKGLEEFLPLYRSRRRWSDRFKVVDLPLFPGYLFCRLDPSHRLRVATTPGFLYIVGIGNTPAPVDEDEIAAIQSVVRSGLSAEPWPFLAVGQKVRLDYGPLSGLEGVLVRMDGRNRIAVSVTLLHRSVTVAVDRDWVRPVGAVLAQPCLRTA